MCRTYGGTNKKERSTVLRATWGWPFVGCDRRVPDGLASWFLLGWWKLQCDRRASAWGVGQQKAKMWDLTGGYRSCAAVGSALSRRMSRCLGASMHEVTFESYTGVVSRNVYITMYLGRL